MGTFILPKGQYMVQGFPVNRSYSKSEADNKFAASTSGVGVETPSGLVNASNKTYTVLNIPKFIVADSVTYFEGFGYSRSGLTITMEQEPVLFIRSFY